MGCGCSMHKRRVGAAQKTNERSTSVEAVRDAGPMTPETVANDQHPMQASPPPKPQHEFLYGMSPPSSPEGTSPCKSTNATQISPGTPSKLMAPEPTMAVTTTEAPAPAVFVARAHGKDGGDPTRGGGGGGDDGTVPGIAPSSGGRQMGSSAGLLDGWAGGTDRGSMGEARLRRMSRQDSLPQIVPSARGSADLGNIRSKGKTLGPGLDFAFREGPTNVGPVAASFATSGARKVVSTGGDCPPGAVGSVDRVSGDIYLSRLDNQTPDEELVVTPVTPDDALDEDLSSERRVGAVIWPREDTDVKSSTAATRDYDDRTPPSQEARPALAAGTVRERDSTHYGGKASLGVVGYSRDADSDVAAAEGGLDSSDAGGTWAATSGAYSLLDAEEEDFMETLLMDN